MKVCITGSAGFIGSNLTEACLREEWDVVGIDNLSTGRADLAAYERYTELPGRYMFREENISNVNALTDEMKGCEIVFHLAALARVPFSIDHPLQAHGANATGHLAVLEAARQAKVKRVIFACSSSIFGGTDIHPTPESAARKPLSPYALQKHYGAELNRLYSELHGLETTSLIYYNVYGPLQFTGGAYSTVIPAFFSNTAEGKPCRIDGSGEQSRDFTYVKDVVQANMLAARYEGRLLGDMFNVANGESHTVNEVYELINKYSGNNAYKEHAPRRLGDPMKSMANIERARNILGYEPMCSFADGMRYTYGWWQAGCPTTGVVI